MNYSTFNQERRARKEFDAYSWMDGKKIVKLFVDFPNAETVEEDRIQLNWTETTVEFLVKNGDIDMCLAVNPLSQGISGAELKKKADQFVVVLSKAVAASWHQLKKSP